MTKSYDSINKEGIIGSKSWIINMYLDQLAKFEKIGLGNKTENGVTVTETVIDMTKKRLAQLSAVYNAGSRLGSPYYIKKKISLKEKLLNGSTNSNGTADTTVSKNIRTNGHESSRS